MVCTSFYSCIENATTSFKDGEDKDMARMLQDNLKSTIVQSAASDADTKVYTPRLITSTTTHTERVKPREPIANESSWSTVFRNRFKKTKTATIPASQQKTPTQPRSSGHQLDHRLVNNKMPFSTQQATRPQDKRLFIRLTDGHDWRKLSPAGIHEIIVNKLAISPSAISTIKPALLNAAIRLSPFGAKLESATNWILVLIPTVPKSLHTLNGLVEVTKELLSQEIERVTKMRPSFLKLYGRNVLEAPHRIWMAFFAKAPRSGFRVFDESGVMRTFKKQQSLEFCKRCNGHFPPKKKVPGHHHVEIVGLQCTVKICAWLKLDVRIVEVHIVQIAKNV
ncbi:putative eka-like protein [Erysiphe necator]|uniref:Putative eka-like protein n=1 Tax=Uncinula necator TaxID=52586 RepID=A0A0B1P6D3_UNCNE|nr:putative eka-like protein [Erysiphe necator]